jgi:hypothetical protein
MFKRKKFDYILNKTMTETMTAKDSANSSRNSLLNKEPFNLSTYPKTFTRQPLKLETPLKVQTMLREAKQNQVLQQILYRKSTRENHELVNLPLVNPDCEQCLHKQWRTNKND